MKANKLLKTLAASAMSLALMASVTAMPAMAIDVSIPNGDDTPTKAVTFTTELDMSAASGASVPNVTFNYSIGPGAAVDPTATTPAIYAGTGDPIVGTATFSPSDGSLTCTKTVNVDFSRVSFDKVGIYRYTITATSPNDADITMDADSNRTLDVYVTNKDGGTGFEISHFVLMAEPQNIEGDGNYTGGAASKSAGFSNDYTTHQLTLDKAVTGNMGNKSYEFDFTINFTGTPHESFTYNGTTYTFNEVGAVSVPNIKLADATLEAVVTGLPSDVKYTVVENIPDTEGYTTTATVNNNSVDVTSTSTAKTVAEQTMGARDNDVVVTNRRDTGDTPATGIIMNIAPYALMVVIAVAGVAVFMRKRVEE